MKYWLDHIDRVGVMPRPGGTDLRYSEWSNSLPPKLFKKFRNSLTWEDFALYPDTQILRTRLAALHNVELENIFMAPGSAECIRNVFECFLPMQSVTTTEPCFPMYDVYAKQNGLFLNKVNVSDALQYNIEDLTGGNLIIFSRPSNPIGCMFTRDEIIKVLESNADRWVLVDEAYIDYADDAESILDLIFAYKNLIVSRSFSKVYGAAGCRIGYLLSHKDNIEMISKLRQMYEISGASMKYALFLLDHETEIKKYCKKVKKERKKLCKFFNKIGLRTLSSQGNWIHVEQTTELQEKLKANNIHVKHNIVLPNLDCTWVRMTVIPGLLRASKEKFHS